MTKNQIEYILALAQHKNFGKAADACFITQSTLSAMIGKFEQQIDILIFNRKTRPISITQQGEQVLKSIRSIYREFQLLDEVINDIQGNEVGNLSIACIPTVAPYLYPLILNHISKQYPKVNFTIHELTTENITEQIIAGQIDIGIVSVPLNNKELIEYDLYCEDFLLYDSGRQKKKSKYRVSDIDLDRLWLMEEGHCLRNQVGKICELRQQKKINGNLNYNCGSIFTLIEMVKMNQGVTLLPRLALLNNLHLEKKSIHPLSKPIPTRKIGIITHKHFTKKRMLKTISQIIKDEVNKHLLPTSAKQSVIEPF